MSSLGRPRFGVIVSLFAAAFSTGCNDATSPDSAQAQLATNRAKWSANGLSSYVFTLRQTCFCAITEPVQVVVDGDSVVAASTVGTQAPVDRRYVQSIN